MKVMRGRQSTSSEAVTWHRSQEGGKRVQAFISKSTSHTHTHTNEQYDMIRFAPATLSSLSTYWPDSGNCLSWVITHLILLSYF